MPLTSAVGNCLKYVVLREANWINEHWSNLIFRVKDNS